MIWCRCARGGRGRPVRVLALLVALVPAVVMLAPAPASATCGDPPSAPLALVAEPGDGAVILRWEAPAAPGAEPISDYLVRMSTDDLTWTDAGHGVVAWRAASVGQLTNGVRYWFEVAAVSTCGQGPWSAEATTRVGLPAAPLRLGGYTRYARMELSWDHTVALAHGSAVLDWIVQYAPVGGNWQRYADHVSPMMRSWVRNLTVGQTYLFRVAAVNAVGRGPFSPPLRVTAAWRMPAHPSVQMLTPTSGPLSGGTLVTILGSSFTEAYRVDFGLNRPGTDLVVHSDGYLTVRTHSAYRPMVVTPVVYTPGGRTAIGDVTFSYSTGG